MSAVPGVALPSATTTRGVPTVWAIVLAGYAAMYLPTYWWAANGIWQTEEHGHGPIIVAVLLWMFWTIRHQIVDAPTQPSRALGWPIFATGLFIYVVGRAFGISILELGSQLFVATAVLLLLKGPPALRVAWFPVLYLIFMVPLPSTLVDAVTGPLKQWISTIVVEVLHGVGYPIARSGVTIMIGPYQMLVADACSGLHSMFSLSALGTLFMYVMARKSKLHNAIMLAAILPLAFVANIIRVIILVLVTYHLGDEAGQGFLHGFAGMALMMVALVMFFALDALLGRLINPAVSKVDARAPS